MISLRDNYSMRILSMRIQAESSVSRGYLSSILNFPSRVQVKHQDGCTEFTAPIIRSRLYTFLGNLVFFCAGLDCVCKRLAKVSLKLDLTVEKKKKIRPRDSWQWLVVESMDVGMSLDGAI